MAGDWPAVADRLGISRYDVNMIQLEVHTKREQAWKMLSDWHSKEGTAASVDKVKAELTAVRERKKDAAIESEICNG